MENNNFVRVERIFNIDEEKLKFRVIVGKQYDNLQKGNYSFRLPFLTDDTNATSYNNAIVKLDLVVMGCESNVNNQNPHPVWKYEAAVVGLGEVQSFVLFNMDLPSRQTAAIFHENGGPDGDTLYRYQEMIPLDAKFRGNWQGIEPSPGLPTAGQPTGNSFAYSYTPNTDGIMCANPFGSVVKYYFHTGHDPIQPLKIYLGDYADVNNLDQMNVALQFTITLLPNKQSPK